MDKKTPTKEIVIREGQDSFVREITDTETPVKRKKKLKIRHFIALFVIIFFVAFSAFAVISEFTIGEMNYWIKTNVFSYGVGEGYPVVLSGNDVKNKNSVSHNGNIYVLNNVSFSSYTDKGEQIFSLNHKYTNPSLANSEEHFLVYGVNQTDYSYIVGGNETIRSEEHGIICADVSENGEYMLATYSDRYASEFNVYADSGDILYEYKFVDGYISSIAINPNGDGGAVNIVQNKEGELVSYIYIFDFDIMEPTSIAELTTKNIILEMTYTTNNMLYAVGDLSVYGINGDKITEYSYNGKSISAVSTENNACIIALEAGNMLSSIMVFDNENDPIEISVEADVKHIASYGRIMAFLTDGKVISYDLVGRKMGECEASFDVDAIELANETDVYMISDRQIQFDSQESVPYI